MSSLSRYEIPYWPDGFPFEQYRANHGFKDQIGVVTLLKTVVADLLPPTLAEDRFKDDRQRFLPSQCFGCIKTDFFNMAPIITHGLKQSKPYSLMMKAVTSPIAGIPDEVLEGMYSHLGCRGNKELLKKWLQIQVDYGMAYLT